jgi:hypothetical protein
VDVDLEEARAPGLLAGARTGGRQHAVEHRAGRRERESRREPPEAAGDGGRADRPERTRARGEHLAVAQPTPVGPALQGVGAAHDPGVDGRHDERRHPQAELVVVLDPCSSRCGPRSGSAVRCGLRAYGSPRIRRSAGSARASSTIPFIEAIVPPLGPPRMPRTTSVASSRSPGAVGLRRLVQEQDPEVGRDRVEAAGVDDPRPDSRAGPSKRSIASCMNSTSPVRSA